MRHHRSGQQGRHARTDRRGALHRAQGPAAIFGRDHLAQQHRAHRPFGPETEALKGAQDQQLVEVVGEAGQAGEGGEPQDGQLQDAGATIAVTQPAADQPARGGGEVVGAGDGPCLDQGQAQRAHQNGDQVLVDQTVDRIEAPAEGAGPEHAPHLAGGFTVPGEHPFRSVQRARQLEPVTAS